MKYILITPLILFSLNGHTDQSDILSKGRDHLIDQAIGHVKKYCSDFLPDRSFDSTYICRLQIKEDCSRPSEKQKSACEVLRKVENIEKNISLSDTNIAQLEPLPLYSSKPIIEKEKIQEEVVKKAISVNPIHQQLIIKRGSSASHAPKNPEAIADSQSIDNLALKINSYKVRVDCSSDSDCKIQAYGKKICGGPVGTFVYSHLENENKSLVEDITRFNEADEAFIKNWNKYVYGTCDSNARNDPAKCVDMVCF
jgi:hypothetical protein